MVTEFAQIFHSIKYLKKHVHSRFTSILKHQCNGNKARNYAGNTIFTKFGVLFKDVIDKENKITKNYY
jgi:hypothetical protein